ncbi:MAG: polymorphic toxin-type HINT domain-containing protein [Deinococcaceae bacterium]
MAENTDNSNRPKPIGHEELSNKWVGAGHLKAGDTLKKADGTLGTVVYVNTLAETRKMYNLEVQSAHTFFVGQNGWLTHNCSLPKFTQPGWIKKDLYSNLSGMVDKGKLSPDTLKKFEEALKGFASGRGSTGIKPLTGKGQSIGGELYKYELKILGKDGNYRLYGNMNENGQIILEEFSRSH